MEIIEEIQKEMRESVKKLKPATGITMSKDIFTSLETSHCSADELVHCFGQRIKAPIKNQMDITIFGLEVRIDLNNIILKEGKGWKLTFYSHGKENL